MGTILSSRTTKEGQVVHEILVDYEESLMLRGNVKNIHVFSEDVATVRSRMSGRGKNEATKYFLVPRELRKEIDFDSSVRCQKIENESKIIFVYVIDKLRF